MRKTLSFSLAVAITLFGHASNDASAQDNAPASNMASKQGVVPGASSTEPMHASAGTTLGALRVADGESLGAKAGYYVLLEHTNENWETAKISTISSELVPLLTREKRGGQELLAFSPALDLVEPAFDMWGAWVRGEIARTGAQRRLSRGEYECHTREKGGEPAYSPCSSMLSVELHPEATAKAQIATSVLSLGLGPLLGGRTYWVGVDAPKVLSLIRESGLYPRLLAFRDEHRQLAIQEANEARLSNYRRQLESARTAKDYRSLVAYIESTGFDPDSRLAELRKRLAELELQDYRQSFSSANSIGDLQQFVARYSNADPDRLVPQAQRKIDALRSAQLTRIRTVGAQICKDIDGTTKRVIGYNNLQGRPVYGQERRTIFHVTAFTENAVGKKIQARIAGMTQVENGERVSVDKIDGDIVLKTGALVWDDASNWSACD